MDSVQLSLLTCQPHNEIYSLYGHTALRYHNLKNKEDIVFNYGVFNYAKPFFVLRFVFGLTDYELGVAPFDGFCAYYQRWGSMIVEQELNLTNVEKFKIQQALAVNLKPENRVYRYNFFYDNCSTRPRNIIESNIDGTVVYEPRIDFEPTYREMIHMYTAQHPWAAVGNDLLLGVKADMKTTQREQEFLPDNLMYDFDHAQIKDSKGISRPLVKERKIVVPSGIQNIEKEFPLSPMQCGMILLAVSLVIFAIEWRKRCTFILWELLLMIAAGTIGIVLFLMLFSQHPTVNINLQFILFNPLHWFFLWPVARSKKTRYWRIVAPLCLLFLLGSIFQSYAEGIWNLALCLLLQSIIHANRVRK